MTIAGRMLIAVICLLLGGCASVSAGSSVVMPEELLGT